MDYYLIRILVLPLGVLSLGLIFPNESQVSKFKSYPGHLTGAFTGGFGEQTCHSCHFDYPLNFKKGSLDITGLRETYRPGETYVLRIIVGRQDLEAAGFQLSARFPDGSQAGIFSSDSDRIAIRDTLSSSIQYVQHTKPGTQPQSSDTAHWHVEWTAPATPADTILFHIAANAANGDASEFGDYISTGEIKLTEKKNK